MPKISGGRHALWWLRFPAECPCGGRKPAGFSSLCESYPVLNHFRCESYPDSGRGISGRQAEYRHAECPCGGRKPFGFSSLCESYPVLNHFRCESCPVLNLTPILAEESAAGRQNTVMRRLCFPFGRAMPPHDGILPAGNDAG
ncbi:MAG: hypothetical protein LBK61_11320 [Spirochaetaceae bacterium]|nr:hypothetical protein [Spirochaetaceae bacterium]